MVAFGEGRGCDTEKQKEGGYYKGAREITFVRNGYVHYLD